MASSGAVYLLLSFYYPDSLRNDLISAALLRSANISVTHQRDPVPVNLDDTMYDICISYLCKDNIQGSYISIFHQDDAVASATDEREHAVPFRDKGHLRTLIDQPVNFSHQDMV